MKPRRQTCRIAARTAAGAFEDTRLSLVAADIEHEPSFTERLAARLEDRFEALNIDGLRWNAKTLTDRGAGSQESVYGADIAGVLDWQADGLDVEKGFLAQAKLIRGSARLSQTQGTELLAQCAKMLRVTPASFVFMYSQNRVMIVPATSVAGTDGRDPWTLNWWTPAQFFKAHFECFIGDPTIRGRGGQVIDSLADRIRVRDAFVIEVREANAVET